MTACAAEFGPSLASDGKGEYYLNPFSVLAFEEPYEELREAAGQGHINAMLDEDGILRHHLLYLTLPDGRRIPSLALALAEKYKEAGGEKMTELPRTDSRGFWYVPFCGKPGDFGRGFQWRTYCPAHLRPHLTVLPEKLS